MRAGVEGEWLHRPLSPVCFFCNLDLLPAWNWDQSCCGRGQHLERRSAKWARYQPGQEGEITASWSVHCPSEGVLCNTKQALASLPSPKLPPHAPLGHPFSHSSQPLFSHSPFSHPHSYLPLNHLLSLFPSCFHLCTPSLFPISFASLPPSVCPFPSITLVLAPSSLLPPATIPGQ